MAAHVTAFPPTHTPDWHVSVCVQALPSLQLPPLVGAHVPSEPGTLQAWHWPQEVDVVLQQTPSTQVPDTHCGVDEHGAPKAILTFTTKVVCDWLFDLSLAVHITVVAPTGN